MKIFKTPIFVIKDIERILKRAKIIPTENREYWSIKLPLLEDSEYLHGFVSKEQAEKVLEEIQ